MYIKESSKGGLPAIKVTEDIPVGRDGLTTEGVLATLLSVSARRIWDPRFDSQELISSDKGLDEASYTETLLGLYGHLGARQVAVSKGIDRAEPGSDNGEITLISTGTSSKSRGGTEGKLDVSGWQLTPDGDAILVTHVVKLDYKDRNMPKFVSKVLTAAHGGAPKFLAEYISKNGPAPMFVRWEAGEAAYVTDRGDPREGQVKYTIAKSGEKGSGEQKAWFQWPSQAFGHGISFEIKPSGAAQVAKVGGYDNIVQFTWNTSDFDKSGCTVAIEPANLKRSSDVEVNGEKVTQTADAPSGGAAKKSSKPTSTKKKSSRSKDVEEGVAAGAGAAAAGAGAAAVASKRSRRQRSSSDESSNLPPAIKNSSGSKREKASESPSAPAAAPATNGSSSGFILAPSLVEKTPEGQKLVRHDAMLILSDSHYYSRSQVYSGLGVGALVYAITKLVL
ncbi:uncharacterized protein L969DRAFT_51172 [Mixia osmundae IAM 14324]|uniref:START domain-containing protein n=1 Tax=Mixia osmundae (strain CBS 9802 / IAM 14324 / JCM 22182 / KY 12970) TaxID=764103 RepID=G7E7Q0_MIXOS|nr:uncharacterized protein L969DRAFT_51172 [Mixia osmundae IAM 14324]KEI38460.1 hypothetical protein L969DRAFT_51172 [Mixia osmundae IAM 14324]GAA98860.1 hypothetical protein E5Q_05548 [Mixia osmundae IAM 14324]